MKRILSLFTNAALFIIASAFTVQAIINWKIDAEKALVKFSLQAHGQELVGNFKGAGGEIKFDPADLPNSSITCSIKTATINTGIEQRDEHLKGKGWFDATTYPVITFTSAGLVKTTEGFTAKGNLTLKGISKEITIPFTFANATEAGETFRGSFTIKRTDFGVGKTDDEIGDEVKIYLDIPVSKIG